MKKVLLILVVVLMVVSFVACTQPAAQPAADEPADEPAADEPADEPAADEPADEPAADEPLELVFVTPLVAHPVWDVARAGFEDAAAAMGFNAQYVGPQGIDPAEMVNQIEIAIANQVDGIITMPIAPEAMRPAFAKCAEAGIPVLFVASEDYESESIAFIGTNEAELGRAGAEAIMEEMAGEPIYAHILQSTMDASFAIKARDGYLAAFEDYEGEFTMVVNEACNSDMMVAMEKYQNSFAANPEINVVIGVCGEAGPAAAKVVKEQGLEDILIVAIDDVAETMDFIKEGVIWGTMAQNFYSMGYKGSEFLLALINDGEMPAEYANDSGSIFVTLENFDTYADSLKE